MAAIDVRGSRGVLHLWSKKLTISDEYRNRTWTYPSYCVKAARTGAKLVELLLVYYKICGTACVYKSSGTQLNILHGRDNGQRDQSYPPALPHIIPGRGLCSSQACRNNLNDESF